MGLRGQLFCCGLVLLLSSTLTQGQAIDPFYAANYSYIDLGTAPALYGSAAALTFTPGDLNSLLIGANANTASAVIMQLGMTRGIDNHVNGFTGSSSQYSTATGTSSGIDGG